MKYEVEEIQRDIHNDAICTCKRKDYNIVNINNIGGNIAIGDNNTQVICNSNTSEFDKDDFTNELVKYMMNRNVNFSSISKIDTELKELAEEIDKLNKKENNNVNGIFNKIKDKAIDIPFDYLKDGIKNVFMNSIKNPILWAEIAKIIAL